MTKYRVFKLIAVDPETQEKTWLDTQAQADSPEGAEIIIATFNETDKEGTYGFLPIPDDLSNSFHEAKEK